MPTIRLATTADCEALANIYKPYVEATAITFEVVPPDGEEFAHRIAKTMENYPYLVAEEEGKVIGYAYASRYRERAAFAWDAELSVYIAEGHHGKGLGTRFYAALEAILKLQNAVNLYAAVTADNPASVAFHESFGFDRIGLFRNAGFKNGAWHDVLWFEKQIGDLAVPPKDFISFKKLDRESVNAIIRAIKNEPC